eukprot:1161095-Pelagomonas_calceolata.AAC.5
MAPIGYPRGVHGVFMVTYMQGPPPHIKLHFCCSWLHAYRDRLYAEILKKKREMHRMIKEKESSWAARQLTKKHEMHRILEERKAFMGRSSGGLLVHIANGLRGS